MLQIFINILSRISLKSVLLCSKSTDYSQYSQLYSTTFFTFAIKNFENVI